jgi:U3 small nucleolar RNA-associated protein 4
VDADGDTPVGVAPADDDDEDDDSDEATSVGIISRMAISADGQWLASTDDLCRTHVFNLDSMQVRRGYRLYLTRTDLR